VAWIALALGIMIFALVWNITPPVELNPPKSFWEWFMVSVFFCASARAFFWLLYPVGDQWRILSPYNLGDLSLHLTFIHWLAATQHWWPASPILVGDPIRYPLGSDLFNSLLLAVGVPVLQGLLWCGLVGACLSGVALWWWGRGIALAAFLFNGGFLGILLFQGVDPDSQAEWKNLFLTLFVTQRGFLYALPAGLLLLSAWRSEGGGSCQRVVLPLPVQVLLLGTMPLFSIHTALYLGVAMLGLILALPKARKRFLLLALYSWPMMALLGWMVATGAGGPSAAHSLGWSPGWMSDGSMSFWLWNFGISLPLTVILIIKLMLPGANQQSRAFVFPAACVFLCCLLIRFAPWPWDNMKLMLWSWIVVAPYLWSELLKGRPLALRATALFFLFASGAVTLASGLDGRHGYDLVKRSDLAETAQLLQGIPSEAVIACAPEFNHPVLVLGHPVVCGYEGHLWSHGLDYQGRLAGLNSMMNGEPGWEEKACEMGVSAIYWGSMEAKRWPDSRLPWSNERLPSLHRLN
jgi:hypothetical protein